MDILLIIFAATALLFGFVLLFGAPYLPTLNPQLKIALDLIDMKPGQHLLELGCGDGRVMVAAAERGLRVTGYELNPILALLAWARTRRYGGMVKVVWGNFWQAKLPAADGIFVFLLPKYMTRLDKKIMQEISQPCKLVSFAFEIPGKKHTKKAGVYLYKYN